MGPDIPFIYTLILITVVCKILKTLEMRVCLTFIAPKCGRKKQIVGSRGGTFHNAP